jgi:tRNA dimethylallyltransferase
MIQHPVIFVLGPTASGKSRWAREIALKKQACILNCDSVQAYKYTDIGSAKPNLEERRELPHLLFDFVEPPGELTAGQFREMAREEIEKHLPYAPIVAVGGSGFYIRALQSKMYGLKDVNAEAVAKIFAAEQEGGLEGLYGLMLEMDPRLKEKIAAPDAYRIKRALGLMWTYGKTLTEIREENRQSQSPEDWPYRTLKLGIQVSREELRRRVEARLSEMLKQGFLQETETLLKKGLENWTPMKSVGYKELVSHLKGEISLEEARQRILGSTMQLAKRQMTWFRKDPEIQWLKPETPWEEIEERIRGLA